MQRPEVVADRLALSAPLARQPLRGQEPCGSGLEIDSFHAEQGHAVVGRDELRGQGGRSHPHVVEVDDPVAGAASRPPGARADPVPVRRSARYRSASSCSASMPSWSGAAKTSLGRALNPSVVATGIAPRRKARSHCVTASRWER